MVASQNKSTINHQASHAAAAETVFEIVTASRAHCFRLEPTVLLINRSLDLELTHQRWNYATNSLRILYVYCTSNYELDSPRNCTSNYELYTAFGAYSYPLSVVSVPP
jgi:hypothetical protein